MRPKLLSALCKPSGCDLLNRARFSSLRLKNDSPAPIHSLLSASRLAAAFAAGRAGRRLPVRAKLLALFFGSGRNARRAPRRLAWREAAFSLSSVGRKGIRSGAREDNSELRMQNE